MRNAAVGHHGQIIEKTIRKNGHSITDVARLSKVNRKSVYNWFNQQRLKPEIIHKIGCVIDHDFSKEFPQIFKPEHFEMDKKEFSSNDNDQHKNPGFETEKWKIKYVELLQRYNELLLKSIKKTQI